MCLQLYNCMRYFLLLALLDENTKYQLKKFVELLTLCFIIFLYAENGFPLLKAVLEEKLNT